MDGQPRAADRDAPSVGQPAASIRATLERTRAKDLLLHAVCDPLTLARLDVASIDKVVHAARQHMLLARLAQDLAPLGVFDGLPEAARRQLANARIAAEANVIALRYEIDRVRRALGGLGSRVVLLKGAAYLRADLPPARGRVSVDLDILLPAADLIRAEQALIAKGWQPRETDSYDQHYYRDWMHEIPPLIHRERDLELDVHHTIFPPVSGIRIDAAALLAAAVPLDDGLFVLTPPTWCCTRRRTCFRRTRPAACATCWTCTTC